MYPEKSPAIVSPLSSSGEKYVSRKIPSVFSNLPLHKIYITGKRLKSENNVATMTGCKTALIWPKQAKMTQHQQKDSPKSNQNKDTRRKADKLARLLI
eukprot:14760235-Ditylum_brightwellii.AAC.1